MLREKGEGELVSNRERGREEEREGEEKEKKKKVTARDPKVWVKVHSIIFCLLYILILSKEK